MLPIFVGIFFGIVCGVIYCEITAQISQTHIKQKLEKDLNSLMATKPKVE